MPTTHRPGRGAPAALLALLLTVMGPTPRYARAARRPAAPRPLQVAFGSGPQGNAAAYAARDATFGSGSAAGTTLYFTVEANGTRNLWQAAGQTAGSSGHVVAWQATALTQLNGPLFAEQPVPLPGGRGLICVTNAAAPPAYAISPRYSQLARFDLATRRFTALTGLDSLNTAPALSPDGQQLAFESDRSGLHSIYVMSPQGGPSQRLVTQGRNPGWLDAETLLFESVRPGQSGLYRVTVPSLHAQKLGLNLDLPQPTLLFDRGGEVAASPDGKLLCVAAASATPGTGRGARPPQSQLYLLASDGSGARALSGTEGAHHPRFSPDGDMIVFDAPLDGEAAPAAASRALWVLPLLKQPPTAHLAAVQAARLPTTVAQPAAASVTALQVTGTAFAEDTESPTARLEVGEGAAPGSWAPLPLRRTPVHQGVLADWTPPANVRGDWTLRLTVTDASGDTAQSLLTVTLPLAEPTAPVVTPPVFTELNPPSWLSPAAPDTPAPAPSTTSVSAPGAPPPHVVPGAVPLGGTPAVTPSGTPASATHPAATVASQPATSPRVSISPPNPAPRSTSPGVAPRLTGPTPAAALPGVPPFPTSPTVSGPLPPPAPLPRGAPAPRPTPAHSGSLVPILPLPALPPAPSPLPAATGADTIAGSMSVPSGAIRPAPGGAGRPPTHTAASRPVPAVPPPSFPPIDNGPPARSTAAGPGPGAGAVAPPAATVGGNSPTGSPSGSPSGNGDGAVLKVTGTPATLKVGQTVTVTATLINSGRRTWSNDDAQPVRLIYRWVDADSGTRRRWALQWLPQTVLPGATSKLTVNITAPPRAGRYWLTYTLIRINGPQYQPPAWDARVEHWPGEFGGVSYAVAVR